jgi:hypothetical protein
MDKIINPILYSAMTKIAYSINVKYYGNLHYMWCTPYFGKDYNSPHFTVPPSSSPMEIYRTLENEVNGGDLHGHKIDLNRMGIRKGADQMLTANRITPDEHAEIHTISTLSPLSAFQPLLCVIPRLEALKYYKKVPIADMANPLSYEYIVADLPQSAFDLIRITT